MQRVLRSAEVRIDRVPQRPLAYKVHEDFTSQGIKGQLVESVVAEKSKVLFWSISAINFCT